MIFSKEIQESLQTIKIVEKDHHHFTNTCCICKKYREDDLIKPIKIDRRSGFDMRQYIENDYACNKCLKTLGKIK